MASSQRRQLGHAQQQQLGAVAGEVDFGLAVGALAFDVQHLALAELGVKDLLADVQAVAAGCARRAAGAGRSAAACARAMARGGRRRG